MVDSIRYVHNLKEQTLDIPNQNAITRDNVAVTIDGILYVRVVDPYKASYGIEDPLYAVLQLAQTTMRSEIGKITLDKTFEEVTIRWHCDAAENRQEQSRPSTHTCLPAYHKSFY